MCKKEQWFAANRDSFHPHRFSSFREAAWAVACPHGRAGCIMVDPDRGASYNEASRVVRCFT